MLNGECNKELLERWFVLDDFCILNFAFWIWLIVNAYQKQPLRRGGHSGLGAVAEGEDFGGPVRRLLTFADLDQGADDVADHVIEEAVGFNFDDDPVGEFGRAALNQQVEDGADRRQAR